MTLLYELDSSKPGTLWSDTGKTSAATNGGSVAAWSPNAGSISTDFLQSTSGSRPIYRTDYNSSGYPAIEFDGSNDFMACAYSASWQVASLTVFAAIEIRRVGTQEYLIGRTDNSWTTGWSMTNYNSNFNGGSPYNSGMVPYSTGRHLFCLRVSNGSYQDLRVSNKADGSYSTVTLPTNSNTVSLCGVASGSFPAQVGVMYVAIYDSALSHADMQDKAYAIDQAFGLGLYNARAAGGGIMSARGFNGGIAG